MREHAFIAAIEHALHNAPEMTPTLRARVLALFDTPKSLRPKVSLLNQLKGSK